MTYTYVNGTRLLHIEPSAAGNGVFVVIAGEDTGEEASMAVAAAEVDQLARGVLAAAGRDVIILDRPELREHLSDEDWTVAPGPRGVLSIRCAREIYPDDARAFAAAIAAYADRAEPESHPDEVEALAQIIGGYKSPDPHNGPISDKHIEQARAVLRRYRLEAR